MATSTRRAICWTPIWNRDREGVGLEHLLLHERSADSAILTFDEACQPFRLAYQLTWDERWRLRAARLAVTTEHGVRPLHLDADGEGHWRDGAGRALTDLEGCIDIDIWPTPFTNTFPIRRQPMAVGATREFLMAYVVAPELTVVAMRQRYTRLADQRYLYESLDGSGFSAEISVDEEGLVLDYQDTFRRVR